MTLASGLHPVRRYARAFRPSSYRCRGASRWLITDLDVPELGCLVLTRGLSGPPPQESDGVGEFVFFDVLFDVKLRQPILDRFDEFATLEGLHLFRRKAGGNVR
jgi:hypothetical protein